MAVRSGCARIACNNIPPDPPAPENRLGLAKAGGRAYTTPMGLGTTEILILLLLVVIIFGARRLPELGKSLGEGIRHFRKSVKDEENSAIDDKKDPPADR